ncbi:putative uncharacterized protein DDB_G0286901 [Condylostylus longicornis]|uniref:putative uncharacterized protein DDB_G0286901 n=1 Tax=Condylostylus longicornis TaxID=2530218 RepID=UPI00244DEB5D|nr:putative uncharacterized protein DDB_G0286901 [Condylostylus longicornis]
MFGTTGLYATSKQDIFNVDFKSDYIYNDRCNESSECKNFEYCDLQTRFCECFPHYQRDYNTGLCEICPSLGEACGNCCKSVELVCIEGICECGFDYSTCSSANGGYLVTASQIALSAALIMGIAALAMVVYRLCTRPKYLSARHRAALARARGNQNDNDPANNYPSDARTSLTSMQIRVINRLRDRPPTYDGINNSNVRDRNSNGLTSAPNIITATNINSSNNINNNGITVQRNIDAPPPYLNSDNQLELELHRPPPYTEVILCPAGYLNESYTNTENLSNSDGTTRNNNDNNNNNNNNNNIINGNVENNSNVTINISNNSLTIQKDCNGNELINSDDNIGDLKNKDSNTNKSSKKDDKSSNNN